MRRAALLTVCLAAFLALPAAALGHGTTTTYASASAGTPPGVWAGVAGAGSASDGNAAATLTETDAGTIAASTYPTNQTMATVANWIAVDTSAVLCASTGSHDAAVGNPAGSLKVAYRTLLNIGNLLAACNTAWTSNAFTWSAGAPSSVAFTMDRLVGLNGNAVAVTVTASLVDETAPGSVVLSASTVSATTPWTTLTATPSTSQVVSGHTYHVTITTSFSSSLSLASGIAVNLDNVRLTVMPSDDRADGELRATGVPVGSTNTLEIRARTGGESFDVQLYNGTTWTSRGTVDTISPTWQTISYGLTAAERNGGTVRVRFIATGTGVDPVADVLGVEYLRVVSTGGVSVSGPTSVTMSGVTLDGINPKTSTATMGAIEVVDSGGAVSGWALTATATHWSLDGSPATRLPSTALSATSAAPTTPDGSSMTGIAAGAGGTFDTMAPITLMTASAAGGVGTYRESPFLSLSVPLLTTAGVYRSVITLSVS